MRLIIIGILFAIVTGCSDSTRENRAYVISQSHLDDIKEDPDSAMLMGEEP